MRRDRGLEERIIREREEGEEGMEGKRRRGKKTRK